jgi:hypothetical protein
MENTYGYAPSAVRAEDTGTTLLLGHTDTVHPRGTLSTQGFRVEGERLERYGETK